MKTITTLLILFFAAGIGYAQEDAGPQDVTATDESPDVLIEETETMTVTTVPVPAKPYMIRVDSIKKYNSTVGADPHRDKSAGTCVRQGSYLMVCIHPEDMDSVQKNLARMRLWIDGLCYPNMKPLFVNPTENFVIFQLKKDTSENSPWKFMYTNPEYWDFHHPIRINLGTESFEYKRAGIVHRLDLDTTITWMPWVFYPLIILLLIFKVRYGKKMIKDVALYAINGVKIGYTPHEPTSREKGVINIVDIPYSLSRFQFLLWLTVIFISILHIWIISNVLVSPTGSVLLLLGISGGTFYVGKLLDSNKQQPVGEPKTPQELVGEFIDNDRRSKGLITDMLNDGKSISLHRLQLLLFTAFLGIYFIVMTVENLLLPQLSETMLGLMGISGATYAGLKSTES
jgi:hypothetical protein